MSRSAASTIALSPLIIVLLASLLWAHPQEKHWFQWLVAENHPFELLTFVALLAAGILGIQQTAVLWRDSGSDLNSCFYAIFSLGLIFVAMEEVSWGQWFFGYETPTRLKEINRQGEINIHNIPVVTEMFEVLRLMLGGLFGIWLSTRRPSWVITAPKVLLPWFLLISVLAFLDLCNVFIPRDQRSLLFRYAARMPEILELLIGLSAFLYMWLNIRAYAHSRELLDS